MHESHPIAFVTLIQLDFYQVNGVGKSASEDDETWPPGSFQLFSKMLANGLMQLDD